MAGINYTVQSGDTLSLIAARNPDLGYANWRELRDANIEEIRRVGRERMQAIGIGPDVNRNPCELTGHTNPSHHIINGIHWDDLSSPTIYPGTVLFLRKNPDLDRPEPEPEPEPEARGRLIKKPKWTGIENQFSAPKIEVFLPNADATNPNYVFTPDAGAGAWANLQGYRFSESVDSVKGSFSFTVINDFVGQNRTSTLFSVISLRSIVKIYEGDDKPSFIGIIRERNINKQMSNQGVKQSVTFSGESIISCISEFVVSFDIRIPQVADAFMKSQQLTIDLIEASTIMDFIRITWEYFRDISLETNRNLNGITNTKIAEVIEKYLGTIDEFTVVSGSEQSLKYNISNAFINQDNNHIVDMWQNILPNMVYEIFSYCDKQDSKAKIIIRMVPFGDPNKSTNDWLALDIYEISPVSLTGYELNQNDKNVYTAFFPT